MLYNVVDKVIYNSLRILKYYFTFGLILKFQNTQLPKVYGQVKATMTGIGLALFMVSLVTIGSMYSLLLKTKEADNLLLNII